MNFCSDRMKSADAIQISGWTYPAPYNFYDMGRTEASVTELLSDGYRAVRCDNDPLVGFFCVGPSAQVPAGHQFGVYGSDAPVIDIGIGMRPDLTGKGLGAQFLDLVVREIRRNNPTVGLRLTVASFNQRADKLYRRFGFRPRHQFEINGIRFLVEYVEGRYLGYLRRASLDDERYLAEWLRDPADCYWATGLPNFSHETYFSWWNAADQHGWVLESSIGPLGYGEIWVDPAAGDIELAHLVVNNARRGHGIGRGLVEALYDQANEYGYPVVYMRVDPDNLRALHCYQSVGFQVMEEIPRDWPDHYVWLRRLLWDNKIAPWPGISLRADQ